jgi:serine protease Do
MKPLFRLLCFCVWLTALPKAHAELERSTLIGLSASVLRIEAPRSTGGFALGSGVAVDTDKVITNCHVTRDAQEIFVVRGGARWAVAGQLADLEHDLCLLWVPRLVARQATLGRAMALTAGHAVSALGFTGGVDMQNSSGEVVALHRMNGAAVIQSSNFFSSGASGGALFNEDGHLVGVLTFRLPGAGGHYYAAPVEWVQDMLLKLPATQYPKVEPLRGGRLAYWQGAMATQPRFLQAASLQRESRWAELEALAQAWLLHDADDAEPHALLALSRSKGATTGAARASAPAASR